MTSASHPTRDQTRSTRTRWRGGLLIGLLAFVAAAVLVTWALTRWDPARRLLLPVAPAPLALAGPTSPVTPPTTATAPLPQLPITGPTTEEITATASRVAGLESRIGQIDTRASAAAANASRAEGLLIAFAARRSIDRGASLGYLEPQLRERFAATQPGAVAAIIAAAQAPVTLDGLTAGLDRLAPELSGGLPNESWWDKARRAIGSLVVVRRSGEASSAANDRLARARLQVTGGQVDLALAEIARLPAHDRAGGWMADARRWVEAHHALDIIEATAITAPRAAQTPPGANTSPTGPKT